MESRDSNSSRSNDNGGNGANPNAEPFREALRVLSDSELSELSDLVRISLSDRKLLPIGSAPPAQRQQIPSERRIDSARGAMLGTAIGDALGRPAEGRHPAGLRGQEEAFRDFQRWGGYHSGPKGTITDDTQMTMCVAQSLWVAGGRIDPEDLARRFVDWLPNGRGKGHTCVAAVNHLETGENWWTAGVASAGNGAAMRVAPIGIALGADTTLLCHDAAQSALITHADPMAVASAVGHAWLIAHLAGVNAASLDPTAIINELAAAIEVINDPGAPEREWNQRPGKTSTAITLANRVREIPALLGKPIGEAFDYLYNGAFVLETLPAALWCFFSYRDDPEEGVINAVLRGHDADTVASMAAAYFGALHGVAAFPDRWTGEDLEYQEVLVNLADYLATVQPIPSSAAGIPAQPNPVGMSNRIAVPAKGAPWEIFALSYDGYERHGGDEARRIMSTTRNQHRTTGEYPDKINTLRCSLFVEQRFLRWNAQGDWFEDPEYALYIDGLVEQIRHLTGGTVPGPPDIRVD